MVLLTVLAAGVLLGADSALADSPGDTLNPAHFGHQQAPAKLAAALVPTGLALSQPEGFDSGFDVVVITGDGLDSQSFVTIDGIVVQPQYSLTGEQVTALIFETPPHSPGAVQITVTAGDGSVSAPLTFTYVPRMVVTAVSPKSGSTAGGTRVTITGRNFVPGQTSARVDTVTIPASDVSVAGDGLSLSFRTPAHVAGSVALDLLGPFGEGGVGFYYVDDLSATSLSHEWVRLTGDRVTVQGSGFVPNETAVAIDGATLTTELLVSDDTTSLTFIAPPHSAGSARVTITTPAGTTRPLELRYIPFTYGTLTVSPLAGPLSGGTELTITGARFRPGETSVNFGAINVPSNEVRVAPDGKSLVVRTPPLGSGDFDGHAWQGVIIRNPDEFFLDHFYYLPVPSLDHTPTDRRLLSTGGGTIIRYGTALGRPEILNPFEGSTFLIDGVTIPAAFRPHSTGLTLEMVAPPHAPGPVIVTVTTPGGTSAPVVFEYVGDSPAAPTPTTTPDTPTPAAPVGPSLAATGVLPANAALLAMISLAIGTILTWGAGRRRSPR